MLHSSHAQLLRSPCRTMLFPTSCLNSCQRPHSGCPSPPLHSFHIKSLFKPQLCPCIFRKASPDWLRSPSSVPCRASCTCSPSIWNHPWAYLFSRMTTSFLQARTLQHLYLDGSCLGSGVCWSTESSKRQRNGWVSGSQSPQEGPSCWSSSGIGSWTPCPSGSPSVSRLGWHPRPHLQLSTFFPRPLSEQDTLNRKKTRTTPLLYPPHNQGGASLPDTLPKRDAPKPGIQPLGEPGLPPASSSQPTSCLCSQPNSGASALSFEPWTDRAVLC